MRRAAAQAETENAGHALERVREATGFPEGGADIDRKGDAVFANGDACAVVIALFWEDLANHFGVSDLFCAVGGDIYEEKEKVVGAFDAFDSAIGRGDDTLAELAEFVRLGLVPDLVEVWVLAKLAVLERLTCGLVEDGNGPLVEKGRGICAPGGGMI